MDHPQAVIKVHVNSSLKESYVNLKILSNKIIIKIMLVNKESLPTVTESLGFAIANLRHCHLTWNWNNTPSSIRGDDLFIEEINQIFSSVKRARRDPVVHYTKLVKRAPIEDGEPTKLIHQLEYHMKKYGQYPDPFNLKRTDRAINYVRTVLAKPDLDGELALQVAQEAVTNLTKSAPRKGLRSY